MNDLEKQERLLDLLTERALYGLDRENQQELEELIKNFPEWQGDETLALTTAAITLSAINADKEMPAHLKTRILAESERFFASQENDRKVLNFKSKTEKNDSIESAVAGNLNDRSPKTPFWNWAGWAVAAAACVALAINLWMTRTSSTEVVNNPPQATPTQSPISPTPVPPTPVFSLAQQREQFLASASDIARVTWAKANPKTLNDISGDVVWSNAQQKGFIRLRGLPVNDPGKETYQLWISDEAQDPKTPIDGGVFDVATDGEIIVPIEPKIPVKKPTLVFNITKEKPGGVVVSKPEKVIAVTKFET
jgi:anti-sigma-K factor RskA